MDKRINNISTHYLIHADVHWQTSLADDRFDPIKFMESEYGRNIMERKKLYGMYWYDQMHPDIIAHWKEYGVNKELYDWSEDESLGLRDRNHWAVYTPENMTAEEKLPLIYLIHGGGEDAFSAETYGFCELIYSQRYMVICPQSGDPEDFVRILTTAKEKGYPIDESRVYLAGFSGGQVACTRIAWNYPELVAGCVCMSGVQSLNQVPSAELPEKFKKNPNLRIAYMCLGGDNDGGDHFPPYDQLACDVYNTWMRDIVKVHNFEPLSKEESDRLMKESPSTVQRVLGVNTQKDYLTYMEGTYWYVGDYFDKYGTVIARNVQGVGIPHQPSAAYACFAWSFLKKFSRNLETGELVYARPSTDFRRRWIKITYDEQGNAIYENTGSHAAGALGGGKKAETK